MTARLTHAGRRTAIAMAVLIVMAIGLALVRGF
jgi:hypothetical protein